VQATKSVIDYEDIRARVVSAVGEAGARELLDVLTRSEADRAALIGTAVAARRCRVVG
jgi:hypothetical protein